MGNVMVQKVLEILREGGFRAEEAYPGSRCPVAGDPVAAVHILKADDSLGTVVMEVILLCSAALGAVRCEEEALAAAAVLRNAGAVCRMEGSSRDGVTGTVSARVQAEFPVQDLLDGGEKLAYKEFTWPRNPDSCRREYVRDPVYTKDALGNAVFSGMGPGKLTISGEGTFVGENAAADFKTLTALFGSTEAGSLIHPVWGTVNCYLTELELTRDAGAEYVPYRFVFREADSEGKIPK